MKTETKFIMATIKLSLIVLTSFVVYMSYQQAGLSMEPVTPELAVGSPAYAMQECEKPAEGLYPTGVVVQKVGGGTTLIRKQSVVDLRLEQALNKTLPESVRVLSFCK